MPTPAHEQSACRQQNAGAHTPASNAMTQVQEIATLSLCLFRKDAETEALARTSPYVIAQNAAI